MTDEQERDRLSAVEITELKRVLGPMLDAKEFNPYDSPEVMKAMVVLIERHAELLLAYDALPYIQAYYDSLMAETTELREAMFEPGVKEMLGFGGFVRAPFAKIAEFLRAEAAQRAQPVVVTKEMAEALTEYVFKESGSPSDWYGFDAQAAIDAMFAARDQ